MIMSATGDSVLKHYRYEIDIDGLAAFLQSQ
jgi:hypothetical protein